MEDRESARIQQVLDGLAKRDRRLGAALIMAAAALLRLDVEGAVDQRTGRRRALEIKRWRQGFMT